jgi:hypothetical protein
VYGIVADILTWYLSRWGGNSVTMDGRTLAIWPHELHKGSLRDVCEMIYGAFAYHDEEDKRMSNWRCGRQLCIEVPHYQLKLVCTPAW